MDRQQRVPRLWPGVSLSLAGNVRIALGSWLHAIQQETARRSGQLLDKSETSYLPSFCATPSFVEMGVRCGDGFGVDSDGEPESSNGSPAFCGRYDLCC